MARIDIERNEPLPDGKIFVRRWSFDVVIRGNPFAVLRFNLYEEGTKASARHRNVKLSKRLAHGKHYRGSFARGPSEDRVDGWWDALGAHNFSAALFDLRGSRGPVEAPDLPDDIRARALAAFEVRVEAPEVSL